MDPALTSGLILIAGLLVGITFSLPISVVIGGTAFIAAVPLLGFDQAALMSAQQIFTGVNSFPLLAIPLFILAGSIMNAGGIAGRLVDAAAIVAGKMPASLAQTNVVANGLMGSVSGSSVAPVAAVGSVMNPRMVAAGYDRRFAAAVNIGSAPAGILLPPSNTFIVYSLVSGTSIAALFMAGVIPGLLWILSCMAVVWWYARKQPGRLKSDQRPSVGEAMFVLARAVPSLLMIVIVIGGILIGYFTATESAAIAVVYCLVLSACYRSIGFRDLPGILAESGRTTAIIVMLIGASTVLSFVMSYSKIPPMIADVVLGITDSRVIILLLMMLILVAVGTIMDPTPAILVFVPIFLPIAVELGIDPVHFGVMVVMNLSLGVITPPVGNLLFVGSRIARIRLEHAITGLWPFIGAVALALLLVVLFPQLSLELPRLLGLAE